MRFRNAFYITADNFSSVFKQLLYRLITGVIFFSLAYVILRLGLDVIVRSAEVDTLKSLVGEFFRALFGGDPARLQSFQVDFQAALKAVVLLIGEHIGSIVGSVIGVCIIYLISRIANGLCVFAIASTLNDRMGVFARTRFSSAYFRNAVRAMLYEIVYVPIAFVYDVLSVLACWFFFFYAPSFLPSWGIITVLIAICLTVTALVSLQALKMTFISAWMPAMIADGKRLGEAMRVSFGARKNFGRRFAGFLVAIYLIVVVNVCVALFTVGSGLLLTVPLSFIFLLAMQFVNYYEDNGKKYFVSYRKIAGGDDAPEGLGE